MLNKFFNGPVGFHNGVKISAGINTLLLIFALVVMRTRLPPKQAQRFPVTQWLKEPAYGFALLACMFIFFGLFYPIFSIQLTAVKHGVDTKLAFYAVCLLRYTEAYTHKIYLDIYP